MTWPTASPPEHDSLHLHNPAPHRRQQRSFRGFLATAGFILLATACNRPPPISVVLITIDTLRADHLGCYGYDRNTSRNIDHLAADGALFERTTASVPRTTQSIASILTGRFPSGHGARGLYSALSAANLTLAEILRDRGYGTAAVTSNMFLAPGRGFEQGFDHYDNPRHRWVGNSAPEVTRRAVRWLDERPPGQPFFLWVHYLDPHWTYRPDAPHAGAFGVGADGEPPVYGAIDSGRLTKGEVIFQHRLDPREVEQLIALYDGEIAAVDEAIGPLWSRIEREGNRVLLVLTSDHGESLGEHGYYFAHGEYLYQPGLHIPLIFRLPGIVPSGVRVDSLAQNIDIAPTILSLLGVDRLQSVDGRPLFLAAGSDSALRRPAPGRSLVFAESDFQLIHPENPRYFLDGPEGKWSSVSDGRYKLIHVPRRGDAFLELYDLDADPGEEFDLSGDPAHAGRRVELLRELQQFVDYDPGPPIPGQLDPDDRERLRSLGYIN